MSEPVLCYVKESWAWFTTCPLNEQLGDDWGKAPYQYNSGPPYEWRASKNVLEYRIIRVAWEGPFETPDDLGGRRNFTVEEINRRFVPWLTPYEKDAEPIFAGDTVTEFIRKITQARGDVYHSIGSGCILPFKVQES